MTKYDSSILDQQGRRKLRETYGAWLGGADFDIMIVPAFYRAFPTEAACRELDRFMPTLEYEWDMTLAARGLIVHEEGRTHCHLHVLGRDRAGRKLVKDGKDSKVKNEPTVDLTKAKTLWNRQLGTTGLNCYTEPIECLNRAPYYLASPKNLHIGTDGSTDRSMLYGWRPDFLREYLNSDTPIPTTQRRQSGARKTHMLRKTATERRIRRAIEKLVREGSRVTKADVAKMVDRSPEHLCRHHKAFFDKCMDELKSPGLRPRLFDHDQQVKTPSSPIPFRRVRLRGPDIR
jgi:hypothetical protein